MAAGGHTIDALVSENIRNCRNKQCLQLEGWLLLSRFTTVLGSYFKARVGRAKALTAVDDAWSRAGDGA